VISVDQPLTTLRTASVRCGRGERVTTAANTNASRRCPASGKESAKATRPFRHSVPTSGFGSTNVQTTDHTNKSTLPVRVGRPSRGRSIRMDHLADCSRTSASVREIVSAHLFPFAFAPENRKTNTGYHGDRGTHTSPNPRVRVGSPKSIARVHLGPRSSSSAIRISRPNTMLDRRVAQVEFGISTSSGT